MSANVWFTRPVLETMRHYKNWRAEIRSAEFFLGKNFLRGREFIEGIPGLLAITKLFHNQPFTLRWQYLFVPLADFLPQADDEIIVLNVGGSFPVEREHVSTQQIEALRQEIVEIYNAVKDTA